MFPFLSFSVELRLKTYLFYLRDAIIRIPGPPIPNALALLSTCRTIHQEASREVISTATFSVWSIKDLIYFLGSLSKADLLALRHVAVCLTMHALDGQDLSLHLLPETLSCFPGLQLNTLTLRDGYYGYQFDEAVFGVFQELEETISRGEGWKELRFYSPNTAIFNCPLVTEEERPPDQWNEMLQRRDGEGGGGSVRALVGKELVPYTPFGDEVVRTYGEWGWVRDNTASPPAWEHIDERAPWREGDFVEYRSSQLVPRTAETFEPRPSMIVARRGNAADYVVDEDIPEDFRDLLDRYSWKEIKERNLVRGLIHSDSMEEMKRLNRELYDHFAGMFPDA